MATVTLTFSNSINASLQAKATDVASNTSNTDNGAWDNIYFVQISNGKQFGDVKYLGYCTAVNRTNNTVSVEVATNFLQKVILLIHRHCLATMQK